MVGSLPACCALAASGKASVAPLSADMNCRLPMPTAIRPAPNGIMTAATYARQACSSAMPFSANSFFALSFLVSCVSPMPRSTFGALVNWMLS
jgi:hypothetical protein